MPEPKQYRALAGAMGGVGDLVVVRVVYNTETSDTSPKSELPVIPIRSGPSGLGGVSHKEKFPTPYTAPGIFPFLLYRHSYCKMHCL